jgi:hypothetical protein
MIRRVVRQWNAQKFLQRGLSEQRHAMPR